MLRKLLKHEFRATGRIMGPLYLIMVVLSLCANGSVRLLDRTDSQILNILGGLILTAFGLGIAVVCVMTLVLMINRFRTNLLGDEGYVMFTLPASIHQQVWSKIIVSVVWFAATAVVVALSSLIMVFRVDFINETLYFLSQLFARFTAYYALNGLSLFFEGLALCFIATAALCLEIYAAMAVGYGFARHKVLLSVAVYLGFQFVLQFVGITSLLNFDGFMMEGFAALHAFMGILIAVAAVQGAVFYGVTVFSLQRRLNLE